MMTIVWKLVYCVVLIVICYFAAKISKLVINKVFTTKKFSGAVVKNPSKAKTLKSITTSVITVAIYFIAVISILSQLGVSTTSLAAVSGSIAVAIGLGAQNVASDIIAGIFILVEEQFNVGDIVTIDGCTGTVESVSIRTTRLRDVDGTVYIVPNGNITTITNKCKEFINAIVDVGVAYEEDVDHVIEVLKDEMEKAAPEVNGLLETPEVLGIVGLDESAVTIRISAKCRVKENYGVERELRLRIKKRFAAENITIPYPQRTVRVIKTK
ncbi:MAG: mechanosensitive ion channel family protein [Clostridiales bacterium]|nr:mechanosensitive ion channel family protein [Clostridiales bacterium]